MNLVELIKAIKLLDYDYGTPAEPNIRKIPVTFSHFTDATEPPFITYTTPDTDNFVADSRVYHKIQNVDIELYTRKKDVAAEQAVEDLLDELELPYDATQVWIESEKLFLKTYETRLI